MTTSVSGTDTHPAVQTLAFLLLAGACFWLLGLQQGTDPFASSNAWTIWRATAAFAASGSVFLGIRGGLYLSNVVTDREYATTRRSALWNCAAAVVLVVGVALFLATVQQRASDLSWRIEHMHGRLTAVAILAALPAVPWIALVWIAHRAERETRTETSATLEHRWRLVVSCAQAFACFVVIAIIPTGALRAAFIAQNPRDTALGQAFPASNVLIYGAFYAVVVIAVVVPLVAAWRSRAQLHVDAAYPFDAKLDEQWEKDRARLEHVHHLDVNLLRSPLTALSVLVPLISATLAYFLPQLAK
ncbi:hypothetical protein [Nocardioides aurantiacus]|uniref:hypothetical protein n=1 Tax=Nocardioides aurantiacus TaxID=86796 RepID=UPI00403F1BC9